MRRFCCTYIAVGHPYPWLFTSTVEPLQLKHPAIRRLQYFAISYRAMYLLLLLIVQLCPLWGLRSLEGDSLHERDQLGHDQLEISMFADMFRQEVGLFSL